MACRLFGAKLLSEPILSNCQLGPWKHISVIFKSKYSIFHRWKWLWNENVISKMLAILSQSQFVNVVSHKEMLYATTPNKLTCDRQRLYKWNSDTLLSTHQLGENDFYTDLPEHQFQHTKHSWTLPVEFFTFTGLFLGFHLANERHRYKVTASLNGWTQT